MQIDEYMTLVQAEQLEAKFSVYLETNQDNILTVKNMPWLDIGDLPPSYQPQKSEAFQVFCVPESHVPNRLFIEYNSWK